MGCPEDGIEPHCKCCFDWEQRIFALETKMPAALALATENITLREEVKKLITEGEENKHIVEVCCQEWRKLTDSLCTAIRDGAPPLEQMRLWMVEHYPDGSNHDPKYERPRALYAALDRWYSEASRLTEQVKS